jgi:hypothetical protein
MQIILVKALGNGACKVPISNIHVQTLYLQCVDQPWMTETNFKLKLLATDPVKAWFT